MKYQRLNVLLLKPLRKVSNTELGKNSFCYFNENQPFPFRVRVKNG